MEDRVIIEISRLEDVFELALNLREADRNEIGVFNLTPEQSLLRGYIFSDKCFTAKYKCKVIGMFGFSGFGMPKTMASIWFLGSDEISHHPIAFLKGGIKYTNQFLEKYHFLTNIVDKRNTVHINWLKRIGMTMDGCVNVNGYEFLRFYKRKDK